MTIHNRYKRWKLTLVGVPIFLVAIGLVLWGVWKVTNKDHVQIAGFIFLSFLVLAQISWGITWFLIANSFRCPVCRKNLALKKCFRFPFEGFRLTKSLPDRCPECHFDLNSQASEKDLQSEGLECMNCKEPIPPFKEECQKCGWNWKETDTSQDQPTDFPS